MRVYHDHERQWPVCLIEIVRMKYDKCRRGVILMNGLGVARTRLALTRSGAPKFDIATNVSPTINNKNSIIISKFNNTSSKIHTPPCSRAYFWPHYIFLFRISWRQQFHTSHHRRYPLLLLASLMHFAFVLIFASFFHSFDLIHTVERLHGVHWFQFSLMIMWSAIKLFSIFVSCASKK